LSLGDNKVRSLVLASKCRKWKRGHYSEEGLEHGEQEEDQQEEDHAKEALAAGQGRAHQENSPKALAGCQEEGAPTWSANCSHPRHFRNQQHRAPGEGMK
jgi:hypothetical protein